MILTKKLWPYYHAIQAANPDREVWLIEDNAPPHTKANRLCNDEVVQQGIRKLTWPPNSPDLHAIENVFTDLKKKVHDLNLSKQQSIKAFREVSATVSALLKEKPDDQANNGMGNFGSAIKKRLCSDTIRRKAQRCIDHEGNNNFHG